MSGIIGSRLNIRGSGVVGGLGTDGQVLTSAGAGQEIVFESVSSAAITAINNATANELVTVGSTTTELDAESGLTYTDGSLKILGTTPTLTIGDAGTEDTKIVFDGNAQDFYIALDDSADDLLIGLGSTVGTTPAIAIDENLKVNIPVTTASTSTSTGSLTTGGGAGIGADLYVGDDTYLITDSAVLGFGADKDTLLTHTDGTGLTLNSTNKLTFGDAASYINQSSDGVLTIAGEATIDLTASTAVLVSNDLKLDSDSSVIGFGADNDTTLTHTDGTGLTLNSTNKICFNDASQFIQGSSNAILALGATDEIDLTATAIDINGTCDISGTFSLGGTNITTTAAEINLIDGGTSRGTTAIADGDGILINDDGTMRMTTVQTVKTYMAGATLAGIDDQSSSNDDQITITDSAVIINEDSDALDFRVEQNNNANGIFLDDSEATVALMGSLNSVDTSTQSSGTGQFAYGADGRCAVSHGNASSTVASFAANRTNGDGELIALFGTGTKEGTISVSGSTISYNAFCGSHWSRLADNSRPTILRGTVMESIATLVDWYQVEYTVTAENDVPKQVKKSIALGEHSVGDTISHTDENGVVHSGAIIEKEDNERLPMCKISDTDESKAVYGVFMNWDDEPDEINDMLVAAIGTFIVRVHSGETVAIGDYLQSKGDGTAKVQADDVMRASTVAKVISTEKTHIHADDSYCVPCTLHCG